MEIEIRKFLALRAADIESALEQSLPLSRQRNAEKFNDALVYAVFPGGKRWRPVLTLLAGMTVDLTVDQVLPAACAIEFLHTSSMIIDDLPSMDDAEMRRGKASLHIQFGESTALLASLALLNRSYALLNECCHQAGSGRTVGRLISQASEAIGSDGMIGGQFVDLAEKKNDLNLSGLASRNLKTTALTELMMTAGAVAAEASNDKVECLRRLGEAVGTAYQIFDDLLDATGEAGACGKPVRQDERHCRPTCLSEFDADGARQLAREVVQSGLDGVFALFGATQPVMLLADAVSAVFQLEPALAPAA